MTSSTDKPTTDDRVLSSDKPVESARQDRLGYAAFAKAIAASIVRRTPTDGIVYAIHGPWGSGKTSAVNMVVEAVGSLESDKDEKARFTVVRFNPWWFSEQSDLTRNFFSEIAATLDEEATKKIAEGLRKVGRQLSVSKELLGALLSFVPGGGAASTLLKGGLDALKPHLGNNESLNDARRELIDTLKQQDRRILVVIDDVDRLPPDETKQIFRLVKSVADLPNVVYLLVFDRDVARKAVGDAVAADGPDWLEKIVQASFDLPPVHAIDLRRMLVEGINEITGDKDTGDGTRAANIMFACVFPWIRTPRDVSRLLNAVSVSLPNIIDDVNITEFIALETLRIFEPRLYELIRDNQDKLTGISDTTLPQDRSIGEELLSRVLVQKKEQVKEALRRLFPRLESIWQNRYYGGDFMINWNRNRQVCTPRHFPAYFSYMIGDDTLRSDEIDSLAKSLGSFEDFEIQVSKLALQKRRNETTKAALVLDTIRIRAPDIPDVELKSAVSTLLHSGHVLHPHHDRGSGLADFPFTWSYWFCLEPLLERLDSDLRATAIANAIRKSSSLVALSFVLVALEGEHGLHEGSDAKPVEARIVSKSELKKLQKCLIERIEQMANNGELIKQPELNYLLLRWSEASGSDTVRSWSADYLNDDEAVLALAKALMSRGATHASEDYVTTTFFRVDRNVASKYVDVDALAERLKSIDTETGGGCDIARQFLKALATKGRWGASSDD